MRKFLTLFLLPLFLCACASSDTPPTKMVKISSIPEGASIVVNNLPMGKAPFTIEFEANEFDCFVQKQIITALPQEANLFTQARVFPAFNASNKTASEIPSEIIFDMTKPATDSEGSKNK